MRVLYRVPSAFLTLILLSAPCLLGQRLSESTGVNLFKNNCTKCHGIAPVEHAPTEATIKQMPPERIYAAITTGSMKENAAALTDADRRLLAEYMGGRKLDNEDAGDMKNLPNACGTHPPVRDMNAPSWNGWGDLSNTRFQAANAAGLTAGKVSRSSGRLDSPVRLPFTGKRFSTAESSSAATRVTFIRSTRAPAASTGHTFRWPWSAAESLSGR